MNPPPKSEITVEDGKRKFKFSSEGVGVNIFLTLLIVLGIFCIVSIFLLVYAWHSPFVIIPIFLILGFYFVTFSKVFLLLNEMAHNPETQHLFILPNQMLSAYKWIHPQLSDDRHKPKEITSRTKFFQPNFVEGQVVGGGNK